MSEWTPTTEYDVIVIGAAPAGENAAGRCADGGLSVGIIERELVGGECSYWGCMPSKILLRSGDVIAAAKRVPGAADAVTGTIDVTAALAHRDEATSGWDDAGQAHPHGHGPGPHRWRRDPRQAGRGYSRPRQRPARHVHRPEVCAVGLTESQTREAGDASGSSTPPSVASPTRTPWGTA